MLKKMLLFCSGLLITLLSIAQTGEVLAQGVAPKNFLSHTVAAKEGLFSIGRMYNVVPKELAAFNNFAVDKALAIGQKLNIPLSKTNFTVDKVKEVADELHVPIYYYVKEHEGLYRIAVNNGLTLARLKEINGLTKDEVSNGKKLMVGYLILKKTPEAVAHFGNTQGGNPEEAMANENFKKDPPALPIEKEVPKPTPQPPVVKKQDPAMEGVQVTPGLEEGFFKNDYLKMRGYGRDLKSTSGSSAVFKTVSGWQDAKYYALMDGVEPGNIIQITNTANGKLIYAKVLGEMQELKQNHGLTIRVSNAAASALGVTGEQFNVNIKY